MGAITLLLGRSRRRRRRAVPVRYHSGVDALGRPNFLYVTDTWRKCHTVEQEFLDYRADQPCFSPRVRVLSDLLKDLHLRFGDGRPLLSNRVQVLRAEALVTGSPHAFPWLGSLGNPFQVAKALVGLHNAVSEAPGSRLLGAPHQAELEHALDALQREDKRSEHAIPWHIALRRLLPHLGTPGEGLRRWLAQSPSIIIDDVLHLSPLRTEVLLALCRGWRDAGAHVVISFETGRDLGGEEAELFFEYGDADGVAYALKPFIATRSLRRHLFETWVATGEAEIDVALESGPVRIAPGSIPSSAGPPDLTDLIYGARPLPLHSAEEVHALLHDKVRFVRATDRHQEVHAVATHVKHILLAGATPESCVIAFPDLPGYAPIVHEIFEDFGIPYSLSAGARLSATPLAALVLDLLRCAQAEVPLECMLSLLSSQLIRPPLPVDSVGLRRWCRAAGIATAQLDLWRPRLHAWARRTRAPNPPSPQEIEECVAAVEAFVATFKPLNRRQRAREFRDALIQVLDRLGLPDSLTVDPTPSTATAELTRSWSALFDAIDDLASDLTLLSPDPLEPNAFLNHVIQCIEDTTFQPTPGGSRRVQVVGVLELRGLTPQHTWLGGLVRGAFPRNRSISFLAPDRFLQHLEGIDPLAEARYLFCSLIRNVLDDPSMRQVTLSWPRTLAGRPVSPAPVLEEFLAARIEPPADVPHPGQTLGDIVLCDCESTLLSPSVLSHTAAQQWAANAPELWLDRLEADAVASIQAHRQAFLSRQEATPGPYDGVLSSAVLVPSPCQATALETYSKCPARYWYQHVLKARKEEVWTPDLPANLRGQALHTILERFVQSRLNTSLREEPVTAAANALHAIATQEIDALLDAGTLNDTLHRHLCAEWLDGLNDDRPLGLLATWLHFERERSTQPIGVEVNVAIHLGPFQVNGRIDRIDAATPGERIITDYKTGAPPTSHQIARGMALQPILYTAALEHQETVDSVSAGYLAIKMPKIHYQSWYGEPHLTPGARRRPTALAESVEEREGFLRYATETAQRLHSGIFHPTLATQKEAGCESCPYRRVCRLDEGKSEQWLCSEENLQRPIPLESSQ